MNQDLQAQKGVIEMVLHVTRKETGLTETFNIVGEVLPEPNDNLLRVGDVVFYDSKKLLITDEATSKT